MVQCIGGAGVAERRENYHEKGKSGEGESIGAADALKEKEKASAEVAATSNVAEEKEPG